MTNIEAIVTDLETSKQLKEAEIEYKTAFVWVADKSDANNFKLVLRKEISCNFGFYVIPAFTAGELMQVLPSNINKNGTQLYFSLWKSTHNTYNANLGGEYYPFKSFFDKLPQQALTKLCLWCRKEGYL